jgi:hypothetical protein
MSSSWIAFFAGPGSREWGGAVGDNEAAAHRYGEATESGRICVWDVHSGSAKLTLSDPDDKICWMEFHPDGQTSMPSNRRRIDFFDVNHGTIKFSIRQSAPLGFAFNGPKNVITTASGEFWNASNGDPVDTLIKSGSGSTSAFSPDGSAYCDDGKLYEFPSGASRGEGLRSIGGGMRWVYSHDGKSITDTSAVWSMPSKRKLWDVPPPNNEWLSGALFTPDDRVILVAIRQRGLEVIVSATGGKLARLRTHKSLCGMALSPNGSTLVTIGEGEPVQAWTVTMRMR